MASTLQQLASSSQWQPSVADHVGVCLERLSQPAEVLSVVIVQCTLTFLKVVSANHSYFLVQENLFKKCQLCNYKTRAVLNNSCILQESAGV